jgi:hypothetical protein
LKLDFALRNKNKKLGDDKQDFLFVLNSRRSWVLGCDFQILVVCSVLVEFGLNSWVDFELKNESGLSISMRFTNYKFEVVFGWKNIMKFIPIGLSLNRNLTKKNESGEEDEEAKLCVFRKWVLNTYQNGVVLVGGRDFFF